MAARDNTTARQTRVVIEVLEVVGEEPPRTRMALDLVVPVSVGEAEAMALRMGADLATHAHAAQAGALVGLPLEPNWPPGIGVGGGEVAATAGPTGGHATGNTGSGGRGGGGRG